MRIFSIAVLASLLLAPNLYASSSSDSTRFKDNLHGKKAHNDLPYFRLALTPRFFDDEAACLFIGECGSQENRANLSIGFPVYHHHYVKVGGEMLNERLTYNLPLEHGKRWVRQYAGGASYLMAFDLWGLKGVEIGGQISNVHREYVRPYIDEKKQHKKHKQANQTYYQRAISGSRGYAGSAGLAFSPFCELMVKAAVVYDRVEYHMKFAKKRIVEGAGATLSIEQHLTPSIVLDLRGEIRRPYSYYEGAVRWTTLFTGSDVTVGIFGGHTVGKNRLPNSTIAGVEIGIDFGLSNYSGTSSVGLCGDYGYGGFVGQDVNYLRWLATPAVYMPEVLAIAEQRVATHAEIMRHHHHHHHHHKDHQCDCGRYEGDARRFNPYRYDGSSSSGSSFSNGGGRQYAEYEAQQYYAEQQGVAPFINEYPDPI